MAAAREQGVEVAAVAAAAARAGLRPGDVLLSANGRPLADVLDLEDAAADGALDLEVGRGPARRRLRVAPAPGEWHGVSLAHGGLGAPPRRCRCRCRFCFVDQLPPGLRPAVYDKVDDYRLSFLEGAFTTLAGLGEDDLRRILDLRLEPLYVSLHVWDDAARVRLMGRAAAGTRAALERLAGAGLEVHLQVVLCPGWNDGALLEETVAACAALPGAADLGIVPVSLREEGPLRRVTPAEAAALLARVEEWQAGFRRSHGRAFVHAADELYLLAGCLPPASDAPAQYENGIGMAAAFLAEAEALARRARRRRRRAPRLRLLTGTLAVPVVERAARRLAAALGTAVRPFPVANRLFGAHVTVTGLLGGAEVLAALARDPLAADEWLLAPRAVVPAHLGRTLDDVAEDELRAAAGGRLALGDGLAEAFATLG